MRKNYFYGEREMISIIVKPWPLCQIGLGSVLENLDWNHLWVYLGIVDLVTLIPYFSISFQASITSKSRRRCFFSRITSYIESRVAIFLKVFPVLFLAALCVQIYVCIKWFFDWIWQVIGVNLPIRVAVKFEILISNNRFKCAKKIVMM